MESLVDLAVIGGGINGCGIARDAAGRGLSVFLCEQGDLASGTSSASTKLIHGGLRYLELLEFRLVREALAEREVLLRAAPHIIRPLRFILPHHSGMRPWPLIRLGLLFYDHLGGRRLLPPARTIDLAKDEVLNPRFRRALEYSDCWVDDARLVILNAGDAADRGAVIRTRTKCISATRDDNTWRLTLESMTTGETFHVAARALVNASGPWLFQVATEIAGRKLAAPVRLVKGSHIVVDRIFDHDRAYIFQNADGRVCFAIPFERDYTLIGTTDKDYHGNPAAAEISSAEIDYLLSSVNAYFQQPVTRDRIRWTYAGVRPLYDDGASKAQEATRDYVLDIHAEGGRAPFLSIVGGKITTYRRLAEEALARLAGEFPHMRQSWTRDSPLPGGEVPLGSFSEWVNDITKQYSFLDPALVGRLCRAYGSRVGSILKNVRSPRDLGRDFGAGLSEREIDYLIGQEWAQTADDTLWRRTKLGLRFTPEQHAALADYLASVLRTSRRAATEEEQ